jgi:hypothetical protein
MVKVKVKILKLLDSKIRMIFKGQQEGKFSVFLTKNLRTYSSQTPPQIDITEIKRTERKVPNALEQTGVTFLNADHSGCVKQRGHSYCIH